MAFYDLSKEERQLLVNTINIAIDDDLTFGNYKAIFNYFSDEDTYIRKSAYLAIGKLFYAKPQLQHKALSTLKLLMASENELIRQTVVNATGEIGKFHFEKIQHFMDVGLFDTHHKVRNAVIGSIKKMGQRNPVPVLAWAKQYLKHSDKEVRREICHGIELRGRTHPQDVLPLLKILEFDTTKRVTNTLMHVIGQISYKKGCLKTVVSHLNHWKNRELVQKALDEIVDVHHRYRKFAALTQQEAITYIDKNFKSSK